MKQCQISKLNVQMKSKISNVEEKFFDIYSFGIDLTFACLREAPPPEALRRVGASAKAGILKFGIDWEAL